MLSNNELCLEFDIQETLVSLDKCFDEHIPKALLVTRKYLEDS